VPYEIKKTGKGWKVAKKGDGRVFSKKPMAKSKAKRQLAAIIANSKE
jgi:hypothetical protein